MIIGIDFDNTIASYDKSFKKISIKNGYLNKKGHCQDKHKIKSNIIKQKNGKIKWMTLQGQVYGRYMGEAKIMPKFIKFVKICKKKKYKLYIISHKTKIGHFDKDKIPLRKEALKWMAKKNFFKSKFFNFKKKNIFFTNTRKEKIKLISKLNCDWFIDDLEEVLNNHLFPRKTKRIFYKFNNSSKNNNIDLVSNNWNDIAKIIVGINERKYIKFFINKILNIKTYKLRQINGKGNSVIYKLQTNEGSSFLVKHYPEQINDKRPRLETEFGALQLLNLKKFEVPKPLKMNSILNIGIYQWLPGNILLKPSDDDLNKAITFVKKLKTLSISMKKNKMHLASEACLKAVDLINQIQNRINVLKKIKEKKLLFFLNKELIPLWKILKNNLLFHWPKESCYNNLKREKQILSSSDFGFHNTLKHNSKISFIDFEYFGLDDPVKLVADFIWHPGMKLSNNLANRWLNEMNKIFSKDSNFKKRLDASILIYGIRWILIILNEFLPEISKKRSLANKSKKLNLASLKMTQLKKANNLLLRLKNQFNSNRSVYEINLINV